MKILLFYLSQVTTSYINLSKIEQYFFSILLFTIMQTHVSESATVNQAYFKG